MDAIAARVDDQIIRPGRRAARHREWGLYEVGIGGPDGLLVRIGWPSRLSRAARTSADEALMVDVDGVVMLRLTAARQPIWKRTWDLSAADLQAHFFTPHWDDVVLGRAGLHERSGAGAGRRSRRT